MSERARITFSPSGRRGEFDAGTTVLDAARELGVDIDSVCGGRGICGRCQIEVATTISIDGTRSALSEPGPTEVDYRGKRPLAAERRLACAASVLGDVVIDVPSDSQVHRQVVRKRAEVVDIPVDPVVRLYYVEVAEPSMEDPSSDLSRLLAALEAEWQLGTLTLDGHLLAELQDTLRRGKWRVTVSVHDGATISGMWPGFHDVMLGVAFDIGSTTIAGHLCDLASGEVLASSGVMNPQIRFGEDLMTRVSYVMMNEGGAGELTTAVRFAMNEMIGSLVEEAGRHRDEILELTIVGNPVMHHLVLDIDPRQLGTAPFALATDEAVRMPVPDDFDVHAGARLYALPCVAGHVGADAAAAILSEGPHRRNALQLLVDVGTNAEIVLGSQRRLLAASSPTGPAFEGAQISAGQRAAPGAIERVRIDRATLEARYKIIGSDLWSDDPAFEEAAGRLGVSGICGSGIVEAIAELHLAGVIGSDGLIVSKPTERVVPDGPTLSYVLRTGEPEIRVTQNDVRAIQLAKAALYAGAKLLMDHLGVTTVDEIRFAGAFGSHIDPFYAMVLGLIPDCDLDRVSAAGNAAGTGAMMALLSGDARREVEAVVRTVEKIETAVEPRFQEHFVEAMSIPHASDSFPRLAERVQLPPPPDPNPVPKGRPRPRRRR